MKIVYCLGLGAWLYSAALFAEPALISNVNIARKAAGLDILGTSLSLDRAAEAHARYLLRNRPLDGKFEGSAHQQQAGSPEYTGQFAPDRAQYFGYDHSQVLENISLGNNSVSESVADLMSAIYHRFTFLDFEVDEMGAASFERRYVYNLGKRDFSQACINQLPEASLDTPHLCKDMPMTQAAYSSMCANVPSQAIYSPPYPVRCENGALLDAKYIGKVCLSLPKKALLKGAGRYLDLCQNGTRVDVKWFKKICASNSENIIYPYSGQAYTICKPPITVHAAWYDEYCENLPENMQYTDSGRYYQTCTNGFKIKSEYFKQLQSARLEKQPTAVIWPVDGARDITPVFYAEDPHPTPDLPMTGYPISIQFNPVKVSDVSILSFKLEQYIEGESAYWQRINEVRIIDQYNDVNQHFSSHQFAWFPIHRFEWNAAYRYQIVALIDGVKKRYDAGFTTPTLVAPLYSVPESYQEISVNEKHFIVYQKPSSYDPFPFGEVQFQFNNNTRVVANIIDSSSLELKISGQGCAPILLNTRIGEQIRIHHCPK